MGIEWTTRLSVGVARIDGQHQELFRRVNALLAAMEAHEGKAALESTVRFLRDYTVEHFAEEARMLAAARFPRTAAHVALHDSFVRELDALGAQLTRDGATSHLAIKASNLLCDWLRDHVAGADREYGLFLLAAQRPSVPGY